MKNQLLVLFLLLAQIAVGQTEKLTKIAGTKCSLIPPVGFVAATTFSGFQDVETSSSIMINELPAPYQSLVDGLTADALKTKGMTLVSKQEIDFNGSRAKLINITQPANGTTYIKQMLVFGDTKGTVLVNGIYPETSKDIKAKIEEALLSTVYNAAQDNDPAGAATFSIEVNGTDLKLIKYMSGSLLYSVDGKIPTDKPTLIAGNSLAKIPAQNQKKYAEQRLKKLPVGELLSIREIKEIRVDNLEGYEIVANGKSKDGKPELIYQVMLFNDRGDYYIILGQAQEDFQHNLTTFKKVAKTFKRK